MTGTGHPACPCWGPAGPLVSLLTVPLYSAPESARGMYEKIIILDFDKQWQRSALLDASGGLQRR